jgi:hypothetical protein
MSAPAVDRHTRLAGEHRRNRLQRRYRRLLVLYPREHRTAHGDEMIDVLLAGALSRDGRVLDTSIQHALDVTDLVFAAARIRTRGIVRSARRPRSLRAAVRDQRWRDALAVVSVIAPLLLLIAALVQVNVPQAAASTVIGHPYWPFTDGVSALDWPLSVGGPTVVLLAFCGLRRIAGVEALLVALAQIVVLPATGTAPLVSPALAFTVLLSFTAGLSLLLSDGAARGLALLHWWGAGLAFLAALVLGGFSLGGFSLSGISAYQATLHDLIQVPGSMSGFASILPGEITGLSGDILIAGALVIVGLGCLFTPVSRRILLLLAVPLIPYTIIWQNKLALDLLGQLNLDMTIPSSAVTLYLLPLLLVTMIVAGTRIARRRSSAHAIACRLAAAIGKRS